MEFKESMEQFKCLSDEEKSEFAAYIYGILQSLNEEEWFEKALKRAKQD